MSTKLSSLLSSPDSDEPILAELFSIERLEQHAESLAAAQRVTADPWKSRRLSPRVRDNGRVLLASYRSIAGTIHEERAVTPAAEWLADNFHIVEEQIRKIREDLPPGFYRVLPKLAEGHLEGYPRVYGIAWAYVAHLDSRFDPETLRRFVRAYQRVQPLTIGELWAVAITLRVVLVENLRRLMTRLVRHRLARQEADALADSLLGLGERSAQAAEKTLRRMEKDRLPTAFAVQLVQRLRDQDPSVTPTLLWLDERLGQQGSTAEEIVRIEHQRQAGMNVSVRNVITSMRLISNFDWAEFFESVSLVDQALCAGDNFAAMDFATRDRYRHAIEELARGSKLTEIDIAKKAVALAQQARSARPEAGEVLDRTEDSGYYLISKGRAILEKEIGFTPKLKRWFIGAYMRMATLNYLGTIATFTALFLSIPLVPASEAGFGIFSLIAFGLLALVPASDLAVAWVNRIVTDLIGPRTLPRFELRDGVPSSLRSMVVMPTLLTTEAEVAEEIERLEVHYLANPEGDIRFALLSDWKDAATESAPADDNLLAAAIEGIERLNMRHGLASDGGLRFFLFHRRRLWNPGEGKWIGWERKRGKLHELNRLLRGASDTSFLQTGFNPPPDVRFIITLDADTRLPRGAARKLIGTMAHPLNRPLFDARAGRVVEGYAVLQPRVTPSLPGDREGSIFQWISSGPSGIDPYASTVSDVYQDLFAEGSYTGKGIYEIDAFEAALQGRVPENALLSHDLFEGIFARAGLVTDVELFEDFPSHCGVADSRQHRWTRGDWQLLPWIIGRPPAAAKSRLGGIPAIGRWKMIDNLRRTLSAPAGYLTLVASWMLPLPSPFLWTAFIVAMIAFPALVSVLGGLTRRPRGVSLRSHLRTLWLDFKLAAAQILLTLTLLAHQAYLMADAILRTLFRLYVTRRRLLEWVTAAQAKRGFRLALADFYRRMAGGVVLAAIATVLVVLRRPEALPVAAPFLVLWLASPILARWISLPPRESPVEQISPEDRVMLRSIARRIWSFFETFVGPDDHGLPPDNFQEDPKPVVAHRTSPTNMGLYLLSTMTAHDFGWLGILGSLERVEETLATMGLLERHRGHFLNWYDTQDLRPLDPKYVSTVDSGNLAAHLLALGHACREWIRKPIFSAETLAGIEDSVRLIRDAGRKGTGGDRAQIVTAKHLDEALAALSAALQPVPTTPAEWATVLYELENRADTVVDISKTISDEQGATGETEVLAWAEATRRVIRSHIRDLEAILPWARLAGEPPFAMLPTLADAADMCTAAVRDLTKPAGRGAADTHGRNPALIDAVIEGLERATSDCNALVERLLSVARVAEEMFDAMKFDFLLEPKRKLLSIGYRVADGSLDPGCYDLLASEARLASFIAIAKGEVPSSHWFRLGRGLTPVGRGAALISWSGSMFEYLMPLLVMRSPKGSLLDQTCRLVVRRQMKYGVERGIPWGISESAYSARDYMLTYQYSGFGVPGLGLRRGLSEDAVVAPYATALAAMIVPTAAVRNFRRIIEAGGFGQYGFYEALDYTGTRLQKGEQVSVVRAYMAHHQGMTQVAIANVLQDGAVRAHFHAEPIVQSADLLLQERTPRDVSVSRPRAEEVGSSLHVESLVPAILRRFESPHAATPRTHLLSNGRYVVMITAAGSGYSRWRKLAVTRWDEDPTRNHWGTFIFLRDVESGEVWSAAYQPSGVEPDRYEVTFSEGRAEIHRRDGAIATTMEVVVSPEDDAELRRISLSNRGTRVREIELTSYAEIVLAPPLADAAHPAFSNLFVQTEALPELNALLASRRPRSTAEAPLWAVHVVMVDGAVEGNLEYETDRARFLGRGRGIRSARSVIDGKPLSNTTGAVLDPIFSLRHKVRLTPGATARVLFTTLVAPSREAALDLADKYRDAAIFDRALTLAWTQAQVELHHLGISPDEANLFRRLASRIIYSDPTLRPSSEVLKRNIGGPPALWAHGISGDVPIVLVRIDDDIHRELVRQMLRAHEYWRLKQLAVDLVILNEKPTSYIQDLQLSLETLVRASQATFRHEGHETHGNIFILPADQVSIEDRILLQTAARAVLLSRHGTLSEQVMRAKRPDPNAPPLVRHFPRSGIPDKYPRRELEFFNGLGGFASQGREYVIVLEEGQWTPAPWINVISNPSFGFQVSESGSGYTWCLNSRENKLTPWSNDPVSDASGESIYVQDQDTGEIWGPTALPIRDPEAYICRHGQGYTHFAHTSRGVALELLQFVPIEDSIKISRLTIENKSNRPRRLSVTAYVEWVLGVSRSASAPYIVTELDNETKAIFARNAWNQEFGDRIAFADLGGRQMGWTCDRSEFVGRNGTLDHPRALERDGQLLRRLGAGLDPCAALQTVLELRPRARVEVLFFLGEAGTREEARALIKRYRGADLDGVLQSVATHWNDIVGTLQVKTPDRAMDILVNRWLLYQSLACRIWARAAFYQAGGAYGFRDQLQDVMAFTTAKRDVARQQILRAAARQFLEGDVQHWWHPPSGRGVRTRISDDLLWLPYTVAHYIETTGDSDVLEEIVPFLEAEPLPEGESESYFEPKVSPYRASVFEHCARAIDRSLVLGSHDLPLIGAGDWNDGMNRVGHEGKGESVWMGWFLNNVLRQFGPIAEARGEQERAENWRRHRTNLKKGLELKAWDGDWYRRAYFDDGAPLGSAGNAECRIDSIAQSWAVISKAAEPARAARAMAAVEEHLVRRKDKLVLLFTPPFDQTPLDPGYIKGYLPGVRENGGQYTHAAIWSVIAFAMLGEGDKAGELFSMLNPINHANSRAEVFRYKVEPSVVAADVYSQTPHVGRGGWTWYTGSAAWMHRAAVEWILGFRLKGAAIYMDPCIPRSWKGFEINLRYHSSQYEIVVENPKGLSRGVSSVELDGSLVAPGEGIPLADDKKTHHVRVVLG